MRTQLWKQYVYTSALRAALVTNTAADRILSLEKEFRVYDYRGYDGIVAKNEEENATKNGKKQVPPVITRHAPLNNIGGTLEVKPIKTGRSSSPGRGKQVRGKSEHSSSFSGGADYLDIPNRMYELYDFSAKTFWKQLDVVHHDNEPSSKDTHVNTVKGSSIDKSDERDSEDRGGFVKISSEHNIDAHMESDLEKLKLVDDIQIEEDGSSRKSKRSSAAQGSDRYQVFLVTVDLVFWTIQCMAFYLTRIVALTIEPFQDVSGVASIGPHILISLLILIAVIAFNGDEEESIPNHHQPTAAYTADTEAQEYEDEDQKVTKNEDKKDQHGAVCKEDEYVDEGTLNAAVIEGTVSMSSSEDYSKHTLANGHLHVKDETKEAPMNSLGTQKAADITLQGEDDASKPSLRGNKKRMWNRFLVPLFTSVFIWLYLTSIENIQRNRIVYKIESNTFKSLFEGKNDVVNKICVSYKKYGKKAVDAYLDVSMLDLLCSAHDTSVSPSKFMTKKQTTVDSDTNVKSLFWLNKLLVSFWSIDSSGGLGAYFSQTIEDVMREQLALVPPSIAQLSVKKFSIGSIPPIIQGVQVKSYFGQGSCRPNMYMTPTDSTLDTEPTRESTESSNANKGNKNKSKSKREEKSSILSIKKEIQRQMNYTRQYLRMHGNGFVPDSGDDGGCEHVIIDADFSFSSEDMDIEFQLHSSTDGAIAVPDAAVSVSHVLLRGKLRMDMETLPDFPFVGNTSIAFHQVPELDMTISSFGGVDLSILPGMHSWINVTLSWVLTQLAHPNYIKVDLLPLICPDCLTLKVPL